MSEIENTTDPALNEDQLTEDVDAAESTMGDELEMYSAADIEVPDEALSEAQIVSVLESLLFATDKPMTLAALKAAFQSSAVTLADIKKGIAALTDSYADSARGVSLEEVGTGYQLRTKLENRQFIKVVGRERQFRLSGPALEVLAIVAYQQPATKAQIDEIRGVESGHLLRALMDRGLCAFAGKSDLPGRPMLYQTTRKFLEIFSLRSIAELPTLKQIEELLPDGIGDIEQDAPQLGDLTQQWSEELKSTYSVHEDEHEALKSQIANINTETEFFVNEKKRQREEKDFRRAQDLLARIENGETLSAGDQSWLDKYQVGDDDPHSPETADLRGDEEKRVDTLGPGSLSYDVEMP